MIAAIAFRRRARSLAELIRLAAKTGLRTARSLGPTARAARAADRAFDRRWGTETTGWVSVQDLGLPSGRIAHCRRYDPTGEAMLREPVAMLGIDPRDYAFVDYGAGKGRIVMLAMAMGFAEAIGVELSGRLCATLRANVARFAAQHPGMPPARIVEGDAAAFRPKGRALLAYFYNPFDATILADVRRHLENVVGVGAGAARVVAVYANPEHDAAFRGAADWNERPAPAGVSVFVMER